MNIIVVTCHDLAATPIEAGLHQTRLFYLASFALPIESSPAQHIRYALRGRTDGRNGVARCACTIEEVMEPYPSIDSPDPAILGNGGTYLPPACHSIETVSPDR